MTEIYNFISTYSNNNIKIKVDDKHNKVTFIYNKINYSINLTLYNNNIIIYQFNNDNINDIQLAKIINVTKFKNINQIHELCEYIIKILPHITNYCIGCQKIMEFQSNSYITCGSENCDFIYEEMKIGNPVLKAIIDDPIIVKFLIDGAIEAINCSRKYDIFEPFPKHFLTKNIKLNRGNMSKIIGKKYDNLKDFTKLNKVIKKFDFKKLCDICDVSVTDKDIIKFFGEDTYILLRFIIMSCKVALVKDDIKELKNINVYKIIHPKDKHEEFNNIKNKYNKTRMLFHGSKWQNWYSIMRNGLKNCSKTKLMTSGSAYGNGMYFSDSSEMSYNYGIGKTGSIIGVFEVLGEKYKKTEHIFVVNDEKIIIQKYLLILKSRKYLYKINKYFNINIKVEKAKTKSMLMAKSIKKIIKEYKKIIKNKKNLGFRIDVNPQNLYLWNVYIINNDTKYSIGKDMKKYGIKEIHLEIVFPKNYPFYPPFIRVISPIFKKLTGHITSAGALCMQILTEKHWSSACSIESLIVTIKSEIIEGEGKLDAQNYKLSYNKIDAYESFIRVSRGHGWL